jgi:hypothetical protein
MIYDRVLRVVARCLDLKCSVIGGGPDSFNICLIEDLNYNHYI